MRAEGPMSGECFIPAQKHQHVLHRRAQQAIGDRGHDDRQAYRQQISRAGERGLEALHLEGLPLARSVEHDGVGRDDQP
jgi:hypothetical protein